MVRANLLLSYAHIALPDGKRCEDWDQDSYYEQMSDDKLDNEIRDIIYLSDYSRASYEAARGFLVKTESLHTRCFTQIWSLLGGNQGKGRKNERVYVRLAFLNLP
jgi:hypothetical protein